MKKFFVTAVSSALLLSLSACGGIMTAANENSYSVTQEAEDENKSAECRAEIPNPFIDCDTLEEAEAAVGFDITVPDKIDGYPEKINRAFVTDDFKMLEVIYKNGDENEIRIRKAPGSEDISGDYNDYEQIDKVMAGETEVTMKANDDGIHLAIWTNNDYTFSASVSAGTSIGSISELIDLIQ